MQLVMLWNIWFYFKHCFYFLHCYLQIIVFGYRCHISWAKTGNTTNVVYIFLKPDFWQKFCYLITSELRFGEQNVRVENCWIWDMIWILPPINISLFSGCSVWSLDGFHSPLVRPRQPSSAQPSPAQPSPATTRQQKYGISAEGLMFDGTGLYSDICKDLTPLFLHSHGDFPTKVWSTCERRGTINGMNVSFENGEMCF